MFWTRSPKTDPLVSELAGALTALREDIASLSQPIDDPESSSNPALVLVERLESLENRFEELRGTCLRHLQSASTRLKKAEDIDPFAEDEPPATMPVPVLNGPPMEETDHEYGLRMLKAKGGDAPI